MLNNEFPSVFYLWFLQQIRFWWLKMQDIVTICKRRGGSDNRNFSHNDWLNTVQIEPDVISMTFIPITSLLSGVPGSGFLSHAINLYLRCELVFCFFLCQLGLYSFNNLLQNFFSFSSGDSVLQIDHRSKSSNSFWNFSFQDSGHRYSVNFPLVLNERDKALVHYDSAYWVLSCMWTQLR